MEIVVMTKLMELADEIRALSKQTRESVIAIGNKLIEAKEHLGHGNFLPWIEEEFKWSDFTAHQFMNVAKATTKNENFSNLSVPISALYLLAAPNTPEEAIAVVAKHTANGETMSLADVKEEIETAKRGGRGWNRAAKPRDNQAETHILAHKNKTGEWPSKKEGVELTGLNPRNFDNALRAAKAFEAGQNSHEKTVSIHVLIEELHPLFQRVLTQAKVHQASVSQGELAMIAGKGQRLLDQWASDDPSVRRLRGRVVPIKQSAKERMSDVSSLENTQ